MGKGTGKGGWEYSDTEFRVGCGLCCVLVIVSAFLIGYSFRRLEANEVGLNYSANSLTIDLTTTYPAGVHFLGVGHEFIIYPKTVQELALIGDSSVLARTKDGLLIDLQCRLLYRVQSENVNGLASLYLMFNGGYVNAYQTVARAAVRDVASEYTAFEFWRFRENITNAMFDRMSISLGDMYGQVESFLLNNFELPTRFQTAIVETDVRKQELLQVQFEEATARTETQTIILKAEKDSQIIALEADAKATAFLLSVDADIFKIQSAVQAELESYAYLAQTLNFTTQELSSFIWLDTMSKSALPGGKVFNVQTPKSFKV